MKFHKGDLLKPTKKALKTFPFLTKETRAYVAHEPNSGSIIKQRFAVRIIGQLSVSYYHDSFWKKIVNEPATNKVF